MRLNARRRAADGPVSVAFAPARQLMRHNNFLIFLNDLEPLK
jgi:hypothetical protein